MAEESQTQTHMETILSTAKLGEKLSIDLLKFSASYNINQLIMLNMSTAIGLISANLQALSQNIEAFGPKIDFDEALTKPLVESVRAIFEKVQKALADGYEAEKKHGDDFVSPEMGSGVRRSRYDATRILHQHAGVIAFNKVFGGYPGGEMLMWNLDTQKGHVFFLAKTIRVLALKKMEEEGTLPDEQRGALKKFDKELPWLLNELQWRGPQLKEVAAKWKAGEDLTDTQSRRNSDVSIIPRYREVDVDARSISSVSSRGSDGWIEAKEIYETWFIRKAEGLVRRADRNFSFLGLKVHENFINQNYSADPTPCSQEDMKNRYERSEADGGPKALKKLINKLPEGVYREIDFLLQERDRNSRASKFIRIWKIIDVRPTSPLIPKQSGGWFSWFKGQEQITDWIVVLKAKSLSAEGLVWPTATSDPFRKAHVQGIVERRRMPAYRGNRDYSPEREIVINHRPTGRYNRRVIAKEPTPDEAHEAIKDLISGIVVYTKDSDGENPFTSVEETSS
ncbi:hypothetical protein ONS95_008981 [Cadophora gregata]|uniref:uncharacterized protein n=1 Tax=Cadophora gregata TaxID=51156 RepID=UPI0026DB7783|nr:uncharacterized protein ONS95_008981 [Cadophora gregata]KAK0123992.1 hypothetical protein ONS95_008981 [Cadophora gregata]KAK0130331.1 hypothetical protein ONS96_000853 [Cadophora gregata f. sp. sojae]